MSITRYSANLYRSGVRSLIVGGSCNSLWVGDSQVTFSHAMRQSQQWAVDYRGAYVDPQTSSNIGFQKINGAPTNATLAGYDPDEAGGTGDGPFTSCRRQEVAWTGNSTDNASIVRFLLTAANWQGTATLDWDGLKPRSRHILVTTPTTPQTRVRTLVDGGSTETEANGAPATDPAQVTVLESERNTGLSAGWATMESRLLTGGSVTEVAGNELVVLGCRLYAYEKSTGFELGCHSWGGSTSADHASASNYDATMLAAEMASTETNLVVIKVGQNDAGASVTKAAFKTNVSSIITKYTTACASGVKFLLLSTWDTDGNQTLIGEYADACFELSEASPDSVAFVNLHQIIFDKLGAWSSWQATYLSDGVHTNTTGDDTFGLYLWNEINRPEESALLDLGSEITLLWDKWG